MDRYKTTFETWNKVASLYQEKFMDLDLYNDTYDVFCKFLEKKSPSILEIGCGPGNITKYLLSNRPDLKILATDVSPNMIKLATQNNPAANFRVLDCREINTIEDQFDGIVCGFCIPYLSMNDCSQFLHDSFDRLKNKGLIYFSAIEGEHSNSKYETASTGDKCYVYYYKEAYFKNELAKHNSILIHVSQKSYLKADGSTQMHLIFIAQKK